MTVERPGPGGLAPEVVARLVAFAVRSTDAIGVTDDRGKVLFLNDAARRRLGLLADDDRTLTTADLFPDTAFDVYYEQIRPALLRGEVWNGFLPVHGGGGTVVQMWATVVGQPRPGGEIEWLVISARDVTEWRHIREELGRVATHDELTGLAGRLVLMDRLDVALARTERTGATVGVLFIDLDDLKAVNDSYGHHAGDRVLVEVARRLRDAVRAIDTVARVGGDEFVVLLDGVADEEEATRLATRVEATLESRCVRVDGATVNLSASIGMAVGRDRRDGNQLLQQADAAMYEVKGDRYQPRLWAERASFGQTAPPFPGIHDVAVAVTQGAVTPFYQSVVDVRSGERVAVQALARWRRAGREPVPAREFVRVVEGTGVSFSLDLAMLRNALQHLAGWVHPAPTRVYVHTSTRLLSRVAADRFVAEVLLRADVPAERLALVVAADLVGRGPPQVAENLWALRELGVRLVLHTDEGLPDATGPVLDDLVAELRLGREAVESPTDGPDHLGRIVDAARARGWAVQATGVESLDQLDRVRAAGCELVAGFHLDHPHPAEATSGAGDGGSEP